MAQFKGIHWQFYKLGLKVAQGHKTPGGHTIPASICLTLDRPDIVIIDRRTGDLYIWELTSCFDRDENFTNAHTNKENKYAYFLRDITELKPHVTAFEVGARGIITRENNDRLKALHKFCRKKHQAGHRDCTGQLPSG